MPYRRFVCVAFAMAVALGTVAAQSPTTSSGNAPTAPGKAASGPTSDVELVERLLAARRDYQLALGKLLLYYDANGDVERARWAQEELIEYHRIAKQAFRLELDVPPPTLRAEINIPQANDYYLQAMTFKDVGRAMALVDNQRRAELRLQQILSEFPQSDKIDEAAYQLGDIYERHYKQYPRAALYFERCFQWNSNTQFDARLRAARIYDKNLQDRERAKVLYKEVTTHEVDPNWIKEAKARLTELSASNTR